VETFTGLAVMVVETVAELSLAKCFLQHQDKQYDV
jgi:hypothetical protein